jgi:hypothetical protein
MCSDASVVCGTQYKRWLSPSEFMNTDDAARVSPVGLIGCEHQEAMEG